MSAALSVQGMLQSDLGRGLGRDNTLGEHAVDEANHVRCAGRGRALRVVARVRVVDEEVETHTTDWMYP